jgi:hypothetical protein
VPPRWSIRYSSVRRRRHDANRFAVKPGHEDLDVEDVVERRERYVVVAKRGLGAEVVRRGDPRSLPDDRL